MTDQKTNITAFTDGGCRPNPGAGGYGGVIINTDTKERLGELRGHVLEMTTNNRMELLAAIRAVKWFIETYPEGDRGRFIVSTDSKYVSNGIELWIHDWKVNGWRTASKKPVKNVDLWKELDALRAVCDVKWDWAKGHSDNPFNDEADRIAGEEAEKAAKIIGKGPQKARCIFPDDDGGAG